MKYVTLLIALVFIAEELRRFIGAIWPLRIALIARSLNANWLNTNSARGIHSPVTVINSTAIDGSRKLVLIRRDNVEYLVLIGGSTDVVIETIVNRTIPAQRAVTVTPKEVIIDVQENVSLRARPLMFMFLFIWALPLSFVPLNAASLPMHVLRISAELAMAVPISAEMFCALLTAALAGWLSDRAGWQAPTLLGFLLSFAAALVSYNTSNFEWFVIARALTGLGYGLAWVGIQTLVVRYTPPRVMTFSIANMTAGIFTGHMLGSFTGGWLADWFGFSGVFLVAAVALAAPIAYMFAFLRAFFGDPQRSVSDQSTNTAVNLRQLFKSRDFCILLLASVIPFSIAQVSLLYYAIPIILNAAGLRTSEIGAVIALYSVIFVFLAPLIARRIDTKERKKAFVVLGGLVGSSALLSLFVIPGFAGVAFSTLTLALASSVGGAAQTSFALQLKTVREVGIGLATGVQRSADKLGQMLGPLMIGGMYASVGLTMALAFTGVFYLLATLLFLLLTKSSFNSNPTTVQKND